MEENLRPPLIDTAACDGVRDEELNHDSTDSHGKELSTHEREHPCGTTPRPVVTEPKQLRKTEKGSGCPQMTQTTTDQRSE